MMKSSPHSLTTQRKPPCSNEDTAQPKINNQTVIKTNKQPTKTLPGSLWGIWVSRARAAHSTWLMSAVNLAVCCKHLPMSRPQKSRVSCHLLLHNKLSDLKFTDLKQSLLSFFKSSRGQDLSRLNPITSASRDICWDIMSTTSDVSAQIAHQAEGQTGMVMLGLPIWGFSLLWPMSDWLFFHVVLRFFPSHGFLRQGGHSTCVAAWLPGTSARNSDCALLATANQGPAQMQGAGDTHTRHKHRSRHGFWWPPKSQRDIHANPGSLAC